ncbi:MAG: MFS transporter [Chloroflexi bacterium]|nr:MFS transporter [Chloroflexota bacterium]
MATAEPRPIGGDAVATSATAVPAARTDQAPRTDPARTARGRSGGELLAVLGNRQYQLLWVGTFGLQIGFWIQQVAQGWLVYDLTGSATWVGAVAFARGAPVLLLSVAGGILADRCDRKRLLYLCQGGSAMVALLLFVLTFQQIAEPWHQLVTALASGACLALILPLRQAVIPILVPRHLLGRAVAIYTTGMNSPRIVGPSLAGAIIAAVGVSSTFLLQAAFICLALWASIRLQIPRHAAVRQDSLWESIAAGFRYIRSSPALTGQLMLAMFPPLFVMPYVQMMPVFSEDVLGVGSTGLGLMLAVNGCGGVVGSFLVASLPQRRRGLMVLGAAATVASLVVVFALSSSFWLSLVLLTATGVGQTCYMSTNATLIHLAVTDELRGRVMSIYYMTVGLMPIGSMLMGGLADAIGVQQAVAGMSMFCLLAIAMIAIRLPIVRRL